MKDQQPCILVRPNSAKRAITALKDEVKQSEATLAQVAEGDKALKTIQATVEEFDQTSAGEGEPTSALAFISNPAGKAEAGLVLSGKELLRQEMTGQMEELCAKIKDPANFVREAEYREETGKLAARFDKSLNLALAQDTPAEMYEPQEINDELEDKAYEKLEAGNKAMREAIDKSGAEGECREYLITEVLTKIRCKAVQLNMVNDRPYLQRNIDNYVRRVEVILRTGNPVEQRASRSELEAEICAEDAMLDASKACLLSVYGAIAIPNASMMRRLAHSDEYHWAVTGSENKAFEHLGAAFAGQSAGEDDL
ncbi:hypothetical protein LTR97_003896 [Elasticomyces elasticus]|uniref:Uncharacterized protein n=1 Tax=Elasticomyces elasticus TaxID=574655 RepID=A0AAN8A3X1_9PEZI|nr:hypothetical protein LTR97_003896 [Elasticomyces elasticus]